MYILINLILILAGLQRSIFAPLLSIVYSIELLLHIFTVPSYKTDPIIATRSLQALADLKIIS